MINKIELLAFKNKDDVQKPNAVADCVVHCAGYNEAGFHLFEWLTTFPNGAILIVRPTDAKDGGKPYAK